ncbi:uncharacterized protein LOC110461817 [Mizuhopecten yessoensis]|uniref:E3 ubiquitin-protein ligase TRIM32 n=1 Tax=Mizuhopecten yessoensis TaxID=6573 RepID=A0A210PZK0_MIZYE|nr:uncharacterized protein LOC110461817 [Mizuhopecten yessoensis]XP_021371177.1 uncharacterized protein LOC110461817 [Mizuhopecten yessoensis]OWF41910.1 E3 ubiquitin-protein ligase TRIM32 [Mizuhopecten yessoensis]
MEECPICMNEYRSPKLLECKHTLCSVCLKKIHSLAKNPSNITCPICRQVTKLPREKNVDSLLTNFFVSTINVYICDSCDSRSEVPLIECESCSVCLCKPCFENHGKSSDDNNKCRNSDNIDDSTLYPDDPTMRGTIQYLLNGFVRSCYCGDLWGEFSVSGASRVTKILPVSAYSAWVLLDEGADVFKFNDSGHVEDKRTVGRGKTLDICWNEKDGLLAICQGFASVMRCLPSGPEPFIDTGNYHPTSLCNYRDDGIVVCALDVEEGVSYVMIYDSHQNLADIRWINERSTFKRIISVAYNDLTQQVCVADEERNMVYLLGNDRKCETYRKTMVFPTRGRPTEIERPDGFAPTSVCCDHDGTIFVHDFSSSSIHVLNAKGKLLGMVLGSDEDHTGDPWCINFGPDKKLWIGDMFSGHIRIYNIEKVFNRLHHRSSRQQRLIRVGGEDGIHDAFREMLSNSASIFSGIQNESGELSMENMHQLLSASEHGSGLLGQLTHQRMLLSGDSICMTRGLNGIEISSSREPENPEANRMVRRACASQVLEDREMQSRLAADGISVDEVLRACTDVDD